MFKQSFEEYLISKHADQFVGTDDMMPDDYDDWLEKLDINEVVEWVKDWFDEEVRNLAMDIMARRNVMVSDGNDFLEHVYDECMDIVLKRVEQPTKNSGGKEKE